MSEPDTGTLFIVATPIGNLSDMTYRAVEILKTVDLIAAEDTRHSARLLNHFQISTRLISCHEHNENSRIAQFIEDLKSGQSIALISDAGTPCISDPGYALVKSARENQLPVIPVPGCSAAVSGLSVSGLPTDSFLFLGFLSKKLMQQTKQIQNVSKINSTLILYESPRRILKLIENIISILGDRTCFLTREMTKRHETYLYGKLSEIHSTLSNQESIKGEIALFVEGAKPKTALPDEQHLENLIKTALQTEDISTSDLSKQLAKKFNLPKKRIYDLILKLKSSN